MKLNLRILIVVALAGIWSGCGLLISQDEKAIREMLRNFVEALSSGDEVLGRSCLMDIDGYRKLNPSVEARMDAESFTETVFAELVHNYHSLQRQFNGRDLKLVDFKVGTQWYQYKGRQAFRDNYLTIRVDGGEEVEIYIMGLVMIDDQWRIVNLSGIDLIGS